MKISKIISFLVPVGKHNENVETPSGTDIPLNGKLFDMLKEIFDRSENECKIPIISIPTNDGVQQNDCKDEIVALCKKHSIKNAGKLAERLTKCTTHKSGLGLLFFIIGKDGEQNKLVISRFPADHGIMAEKSANSLSVVFIEEVFMKNAKAYKSVLYSGKSPETNFWEGSAIDKQITTTIRELSNYWIKDFLLSDFKTTPKEGTKRLAKALKNALGDVEDIRIKEELMSSAVLAKNLNNQPISINSFCEKYNLSNEAKKLIIKQLGRHELADSNFVFDSEEFSKHALYKSVELDTGATLIANTDKFDECFNTEIIDKQNHRYRFSTEGTLVNTKLRARN